MLFMIIAFISILVHVGPGQSIKTMNETPPLPAVELEIFGDGTAGWVTDVVHNGTYSVRLLIPEGASTSSLAIVKVPYGNALDTLESFSFYVKYIMALPRFVVYLDKDRDGTVDGLLLSDYLDFGSGEWVVGVGGLRWGWTEATYPITEYGRIWKPFEDWQGLYGNATALYVAAALEYWAAEPEGLGEPLYVDTVTINGITYDLEPAKKQQPCVGGALLDRLRLLERGAVADRAAR